MPIWLAICAARRWVSRRACRGCGMSRMKIRTDGAHGLGASKSRSDPAADLWGWVASVGFSPSALYRAALSQMARKESFGELYRLRMNGVAVDVRRVDAQPRKRGA